MTLVIWLIEMGVTVFLLICFIVVIVMDIKQQRDIDKHRRDMYKDGIAPKKKDGANGE